MLFLYLTLSPFTAVKVSKLSLIAASTAVLVQEKIQHEINGHGHGHGHLHDNDYDIEVVDMDEQNDLKQGGLIYLFIYFFDRMRYLR